MTAQIEKIFHPGIHSTWMLSVDNKHVEIYDVLNVVNMWKWVTNSQWYLFIANLDSTHSANPTNPTGNCK